MKALTIRQPWAWAIFHAGKDVENRNWPTSLRGRVAIHAAKGLTVDEHIEASAFIRNVARAFATRFDVPDMLDLQRGVILGTVEIAACVNSSGSAWFMGRFGFVLRNPVLFTTPIPAKGALGFWEWE